MWQVITKPKLLIFLHSSFETSTKRRKLNWQRADYDEQTRRLAHAREHANVIIDTNPLTPAEVLARALDYLKEHIT